MKNRIIRHNSKDVIFELIDGEIVLLNLANGNYYTIDGLGVIIWELILKLENSKDIVNYLFKLYNHIVDIEIVKKTIFDFADELINAKLVSLIDFKQTKAGKELNEFNETKILPAFKKPILQTYQKMQEKYAHPCGIKRSDE